MSRRLLCLLCWLFALFALFAPGAGAQDEFNYPPPELGPEYVEPTTAFPEARELLPPLVEVGVLAAAILLATYLAHRWRSRRGLLALSIGSLIWFGFLREGCICPVGSLQNVAEALANSKALILPGTILFFVIPLVTTLFWGRTFCAAVCPLGAIQEVVLLRPTTVPRWLAAGLTLLPHAYLALVVLYAVTGAGYLICRYDPFVGFFRLGATSNMLVVGAGLLFISVFVGRPYCRFLCPYGVLLGWASKVSAKQITITPDACLDCRLCEGSCPYDAITEPNERAIHDQPLRGRRSLIAVIALAPLLVAGVGFAGSRLGPELARGHPRVALAEEIEAEQSGRVRETTDHSDVFRASGESVESLFQDAAARREDFVFGGWLAGAFVGLMVAFRLLGLSIRRTRVDYQADRENCLACGRCFEWCPVELEQRRTGAPPEVKR